MVQLTLLLGWMGGTHEGAFAGPRGAFEEARALAISAAGHLGPHARPLAPLLLRLLQTSRQAKVRSATARALGRIGPGGDRLADERSPLVAGLLRSLDREAEVAPCVEILRALRRTSRPTPAVCAAVARALRHGDAVVDLLADCAPSTQMAVLRAGFSGERPEKAAVALRLVCLLGPPARPLLPALVRLLQHEDREVRGDAARAVLAVEVPSLVPKADAVLAALVEGLDDNGMCHAPGINAPLGHHAVPLPRTARALAALLRARDDGVRFLAARALSQIPASASISIPSLEAAVFDEDFLVRLAAAASLVALGRRDTWLPVLRDLRAQSKLFVNWAYCEGITEEDARLSHRHVRKLPTHERAHAAFTLWRAGRHRADGLRIHDPRQVAIEVLGELLDAGEAGPPEALLIVRLIGPPAVRLWPRVARLANTSAGPFVLGEAIEALGRLGPGAARAEPVLVRLLDHSSPDLRLSAAVALNNIKSGHRHALPTVLAVARRHPIHAESAFRALRWMGPDARAAVPWLVRLLRSDLNEQAARSLWVVDPDTARKAGAW